MNKLLSVLPARFIADRPAADQMQWAQNVLGCDIAAVPRRYFFQRPEDKGSYVLPLRQSFIKDARLMPGTRIMLALLVGWAGTGRPPSKPRNQRSPSICNARCARSSAILRMQPAKAIFVTPTPRIGWA